MSSLCSYWSVDPLPSISEENWNSARLQLNSPGELAVDLEESKDQPGLQLNIRPSASDHHCFTSASQLSGTLLLTNYNLNPCREEGVGNKSQLSSSDSIQKATKVNMC